MRKRQAPGRLRIGVRPARRRSVDRRLRFEPLESRQLMAATTIEVLAAGQTGTETMELRIDGAAVATFTNVGGNINTPTYQTFTYTHPTDVTASQIRVALTNDSAAVDRNLRVDAIRVNGVLFQSEDASVLSTGTWDAVNGCSTGNKQSEWLHCNGYFQYANLAPPEGSTIQIRAAGQTHEEVMQLRIDGVTVATFNVTGGDTTTGQFQAFSYTHSSMVTADQVQVAFTNDGRTATNADKNLRVDGITIDGTVFESEALSVYSTGTWMPADGCAPGYRQSEWLHCGGYFQYSEPAPSVGSVIVIDAAGQTGTETMVLRVDGAAVATFTNVGGDVGSRVFQTLQYQHPTVLSIDQIRVALTNDSAAVDRNLRVDGVTLDGVRFEAEAASTLSTGTWEAATGCSPGYKQSEFLHCNGYFQFSEVQNFGTLALDTSNESVDEDAGTVSIPVVRTGGSDGTVTIDYTTVPGSALAGEDFEVTAGTLTFGPGQVTQFIVVPLINDDDIEGNEAFNVAVDFVGGGAILGFPRTATITIRDDESPPQPGTGNGLLGQYHTGVNFNELVFERVDATVDFNWGTGSPDASIPVDNFSVRWVGQIEPLYSELYTFSLQTDDGARLWVNNQLIIDRWTQTGTFTGQIALQALERVDMRLEYFEGTGQAREHLRWSSASQAFQVVPQSQLYADEPIVLDGTFSEQELFGGLDRPVALDFAPDGRMFIAEKAGIVRIAQNGQLLAQPFIDISAMVNDTHDRGLLGIAVHPNFPANPYVYLAFTYDPQETVGQTGLAGPDGSGNRVARLIRVTADANFGFNRAVPGSEVVLLGANSTWDNISNPDLDSTDDITLPPSCPPDGTLGDCLPADSRTHTIGNIDFGLDGMLYVTNGDGTTFGRVDPRTERTLNLDSLSGKLLRIDPITGQGLSDNPFYNGDPNANRSKVVDYGMRNPFRFAFHPVTGEPYLGDVGWTTWEEINRGWGKNFGWPFFEGGNGTNLQTGGYQDLEAAQAYYATNPDVTPPIWARTHADGAVAIVAGDFYSGNVYTPVVQNALFFTDLGDPRLQALLLNADGSFRQVITLKEGVNPIVEMSMNPVDGHIYYADYNGAVGRYIFTQAAPLTATTSAAVLADFNQDGETSGLDFLAWQIGAGASGGATIAEGDANQDGAVNDIDLGSWETHYGRETFAPTEFAAASAAPPCGCGSMTAPETPSAEVATLLAVPEPIEPAVAPTAETKSALEEFLNPSCGCKGKIARSRALVAALAARVYWESLDHGAAEVTTHADETVFDFSPTAEGAWLVGAPLLPKRVGLEILDLVDSSGIRDSADDAFATLAVEGDEPWVTLG